MDRGRIAAGRYTHCLEAGGEHVAPAHFRGMMACAEICRGSAHTMLLGAQNHAPVCRACVALCRDCAASCERIDGMQDCAQACQACAQACERMAR
ncbi:MAG: four-helix bundle copper-binding protein [Achromobacter sp.]